MFILYAIPLGLLVGLLAGGTISGLGNLRFRLGWLVFAGLMIQVILFSGQVASRIGDLGVPIYLFSNALVLAAILANVRVPGLPLVAIGSGLNLLVIVANGGYMPASAEAYAMHGVDMTDGYYSNTRVFENPLLPQLSDVIPMPTWLPFANVISIGDLLIAGGIVVAIAAMMRSGRGPAAHDVPVDAHGPASA
jgi:hypothetical protein